MAGAMAALTRATAGRAVHLQITPRLTSLGESQELLRLMSRFGEVEMYRSLKYNEPSRPRSAVVIFRDESAARESIKQSPLRFYMGRSAGSSITTVREENRPISSEAAPQAPAASKETDIRSTTRSVVGSASKRIASDWGLSADILADSPSRYRRDPGSRQTPMPDAQPIAANAPEHETETPADPSNPETVPYTPHFGTTSGMALYNVKISPAYMNFREIISTSRFQGNYTVDTKSAAQHDLAERVPLPGLGDLKWQETRPWRLIEAEQNRENAARKSLRQMYDESEPDVVPGAGDMEAHHSMPQS